MGISDRIEGTVENWRTKWGEALKNFLASFLSLGLDVFFRVLGKSFAPKLKPLIDTIERSGEVPPELQPLLDEMKKPTGEAAAALGSMFGYSFVGGAIGKVIDAIFNPLGYWANRVRQNLMPDLPQLMALWLRGHVKDEDMSYFLTSYGFKEEMTPMFEDLAHIRLDPATITAIWRRDKTKYEELWEDLKHQGWTENRIAVVKELAKVIPPLADMVRFADFSSFDPEVIAKYPIAYEPISEVRDAFKLVGIEGDWANKYWFSHWVQPGRYEIGEMHRRGLINDEDAKLAYRTMAYSDFWRPKLLELVKEVPTRVDVRRFWDMRTIDEARLREIYHAQGYYDKDLDDYVLWTKVYVAFPDLLARFKNGWITEDEVKNELTAIGMPTERVQEMWETKFRKMEGERTAGERDLTKAEIYAGVKKGVFTWEQGLEMLQDLGYDTDEAKAILEIRVGALEGSPETYSEMKRWTQLLRKAQGLEAHIPPAELQEAEVTLREAEAAYERAEGEGLKGEKLAPYDKAKSDASYRYRQLLTKWLEEIKQGKA